MKLLVFIRVHSWFWNVNTSHNRIYVMPEINPDNPIQVCFIAPKAYPIFNPQIQSAFGGAEVDLYYISTELAKDSNYQVSFIVADYGQDDEEIIDNIQIIKSLNFNQNVITGAMKIWRALKKANADIYIIKTASPGVPLTARFCKKHQKAFIYRTAHTRECDGDYLKQHFILGRLFNRALKNADQVFTQNNQDRENLLRTIRIDSVVIRNAHQLPDLPHSKKESILWVGRSARVKGPEHFIELARKFPDEKFVMICRQATGDTSYDILRQTAVQVPNLEFLERVDFHQIDHFFKAARVFVNTSDSEGFPNTFIQACKSAAAILSLNVNPDNFLTDNNCGLICHNSQEKLIESLKNLLHKQTYVELGQNGREYVSRFHDITQIIEQYKPIFGNVATGNRKVDSK